MTGNGLKDVANAIKSCGEPMSCPNDMDALLTVRLPMASNPNEN